MHGSGLILMLLAHVTEDRLVNTQVALIICRSSLLQDGRGDALLKALWAAPHASSSGTVSSGGSTQVRCYPRWHPSQMSIVSFC